MLKKVILYLWQLPQHIIALFILKLLNKDVCITDRSYSKNVYFVKYGVFECGISLGDYIILDKKYFSKNYVYITEQTIKHEIGHSKQSLYFGWLYLLVIGIPSMFNNIWDRLFHKKWEYEKRVKWYYSRYPEKWADKLGAVNRC